MVIIINILLIYQLLLLGIIYYNVDSEIAFILLKILRLLKIYKFTSKDSLAIDL